MSHYRSLEITTKVGCHLLCSYCPQDTFTRSYMKRSPESLMTFETFQRCIDTVPRDVPIHFSGFVEPWLNPECTKMISYAHTQGFQLHVFTTGVGLKEEDIKVLEGIPFMKFAVHLPDEISKMKVKIDDAYVYLIATLFHSKIQNIQYDCPDGPDQSLDPRLKKILIETNAIEQNPTIHTRAGNVDIENKRPPEWVKGPIAFCERIDRNVLLPNGDVTLCCMDWGLKHILGNLLKNSFSDLREGEEYKKIIRGLTDDSVDILCRKCEFGRTLNLETTQKKLNLTHV